MSKNWCAKAASTDARVCAGCVRSTCMGFEDEVTPWTEELLDRAASGEAIYVPAHWPLEVLNALLMAQRRGRIAAARIQEFINELGGLEVHIAASPSPLNGALCLA